MELQSNQKDQSTPTNEDRKVVTSSENFLLNEKNFIEDDDFKR